MQLSLNFLLIPVGAIHGGGLRKNVEDYTSVQLGLSQKRPAGPVLRHFPSNEFIKPSDGLGIKFQFLDLLRLLFTRWSLWLVRSVKLKIR